MIEPQKKCTGTSLPAPIKLLQAGARVSKVGSLMFLLLGPKNYQICPQGVKRIGWIGLTVVPNNELRIFVRILQICRGVVQIMKCRPHYE